MTSYLPNVDDLLTKLTAPPGILRELFFGSDPTPVARYPVFQGKQAIPDQFQCSKGGGTLLSKKTLSKLCCCRPG
jgi:hypothetical protein